MSKTMSSPPDWPQFYHQNLSINSMFGDQQQGSDDPTITPTSSTMITSSSSAAAMISSPLGTNSSGPATTSSGTTTGGGGGHLSPEGRVGKPVRRRSRASRRTPTTLLNTDTTNFRAMVQQFTGGPSSAPYASAPHGAGGPNFGFSFSGGLRQQQQPHLNHSSLMAPPLGFHLQYQQQQQQLIQQQQQQHQNQASYLFSLNNNNNNINNNNPGGAAGELFLQRLGGNHLPRAATGGDGSSERFVLEGVSSQLPAPTSRTTTTSTNSTNENRSNPTTFMF